MSNWFYYTVVATGRFVFWTCSRPVVLHRDRVPRHGPFVLAANHITPIDPALFMRHTPRMLEFLTMKELLDGLMGWFFRGMNTIPLDRGRVDTRATRDAVERLARGRAVGLFPEGRIRPRDQSVVAGAPFGPGAVRLARTANVPLLPAVVWDAEPFLKPRMWLPLKAVRYGLIYGQPFHVTNEADATTRLSQTFQDLHRELKQAMA